jgi:ABC-type Zn uptake system ZnuABC Zn-binding protein ZnuA
MRRTIALLIALSILPALFLGLAGSVRGEEPKEPLRVVTTLPDYAVIARAIGGDRVEAEHIVLGDQDAHFIRPKPSFVSMVREADVLVSTGLDLELWVPTIVDKSGNARIRSGQIGFVAAARGIPLLEKPKALSRSEGGVHIYGNPHINCSPLNMRVVARNIAYGLVKNDPAGKDHYLKNLKTFRDEIDRRTYGKKLVELLGGDTLTKLAEKGRLIPFLKKKKLGGRPLIEHLGGWLAKMMPLRERQIVTYHKNWVYFMHLFGLYEFATIEPKPGIPPSPRHVTEVIRRMKAEKVRIILAANYFDESKIEAVADRVGGVAAIVPLYVGGKEGVDDCFQLVDCWTDVLLAAAKKAEGK